MITVNCDKCGKEVVKLIGKGFAEPRLLCSDCIDNICDCEPFQSCEKCARITRWFPLSQMKQGVHYWILDKDNNIGVGYLADEHKIKYRYEDTPEEFGTPVMFAEIKPPAVP